MPSTSHAPWRPPHDHATDARTRVIVLALALRAPRGVLRRRRRRRDRRAATESAAASAAAVGRRGRRPTARRAQPAPLGADQTRTVTLTTAKGDIVIELKGALSPDRGRQLRGARRVRLLRRHGVPPDRPGLRHPGWRRPVRASRTSTRPAAGTGGPPLHDQGRARHDARTTAARSRWPAPRSRTPSARSSSSSSTMRPGRPLASANTYQIIGEVTLRHGDRRRDRRRLGRRRSSRPTRSP